MCVRVCVCVCMCATCVRMMYVSERVCAKPCICILVCKHLLISAPSVVLPFLGSNGILWTSVHLWVSAHFQFKLKHEYVCIGAYK